jgi:ATP-dependent DNA helicase RecG
VEEFLLPYEALREALLNAVVHKDYSCGIPIQISVYEDHLVLWNYGQLPEEWTIERFLGKHSSVPYNPLLANAFFRAGYIESWGCGIEKIARECHEHGIDLPVYEFARSGLMMTFRANSEHLVKAGIKQELGKKKPGGTAQNTDDSGVKTQVKTRVKTSL